MTGVQTCALPILQAVITHRYDVLAKYAKSLRQTCAAEIRNLRARAVRIDRSMIRRLLHRDARTLPSSDQHAVQEALRHSKVLETVFLMRQELAALWQRSNASKEQLVHQLEDWCARAERSGIEALEQFSRRLRCYA